jgi:cold shock CspA family protein
MQGTVRWYSAQGFGFIDASASSDGEAYYFHITAVKNRSVLKTGDTVSFDPTQSPKGLRAVNVRVQAVETQEENQCQQKI